MADPETELIKDVAGLKAQMGMMLDILKEIQKGIMPTGQIDERFRAVGERVGALEVEHRAFQADVQKKFLEVASATAVEKIEMETNRKFLAIEVADDKASERKRESPYKIIAAIAALIASVTGSGTILWWAVHTIK